MNYRDSICEHLTKYKVEILRIRKPGFFNFRGRKVPKAHILPPQNRGLNLLPTYSGRFWASQYSKIKLHKYFHHLNSSQAMCINLFYPLVAESALDLIVRFLGIAPALDLQACFEKESEIEQAIRRTNFDFHIRYDRGKNIFFEIKYTENGFSRAKDDDYHQHKFRNTYLPLVERSDLLSEECRDKAFFLRHYQILRNLVHLASNSYMVFLFPRANSTVSKEVDEAYNRLLTDAGRNRVKVEFLEKLVSFLEANCSIDPLVDHYAKFRMKYFPS